MIRFQDFPREQAVSIVRFYADENAGPMGPYDALCLVTWEPPDVVWVHGLMGQGTRRLWREFVREVHERGVRLIRAWRAEGRVLPRAVRRGDGSYEMRVEDLLARPVDTAFQPL